VSESHRREAFTLALHNPMPAWMVQSLEAAGISGLVERRDQPAYLPPWFVMPDHVARLVARHRRGGEYRVQPRVRRRPAALDRSQSSSATTYS